MPPGYGGPSGYAGYPSAGPGYPPYGTPPKSNAGRTVGLIVGVTAVGVVGVLVVLILAVTFLGRNASSRFSSVGSAVVDPPITSAGSTWTPYTAPDSSFRASFPGTPIRKDETVRGAGFEIEVSTHGIARTSGLVEITTTKRVPGMVWDDSLIDAMIGGAVSVVNGTVTSRAVGITLEGPATDVEIATPAGVSLMRLLRTDNRVYLLHVSGMAPNRADFTKLTESFSVPA